MRGKPLATLESEMNLAHALALLDAKRQGVRNWLKSYTLMRRTKAYKTMRNEAASLSVAINAINEKIGKARRSR